MMKKFCCIMVFCVILLLPLKSFGSVYIGLGPEFSMPIGDFGKVNKESFGASLFLESRTFCAFWYGLRIDYISYQKIDKEPPLTDYYKDALLTSLEARYNFCNFPYAFGKSSFVKDHKIMPYIQAMLTYSSIDRTVNESNLGFGWGLGAGVVFDISSSSTCWHLDLNGLYAAPNMFMREKERPSLQSINVSLTLSMGI